MGKYVSNFTLQEIETRVGSDRSVAVLRHLLTYTDGAVILDAQAVSDRCGSAFNTLRQASV